MIILETEIMLTSNELWSYIERPKNNSALWHSSLDHPRRVDFYVPLTRALLVVQIGRGGGGGESARPPLRIAEREAVRAVQMETHMQTS